MTKILSAGLGVILFSCSVFCKEISFDSFEFRVVGESRIVKAADFKGRPVLLNFWATWCDSCIQELKLINEIASGDLKNKIHVVSVNLDNDEKKMKDFLKDNNFSFLIVSSDRSLDLLKEYTGSERIPVIVMLDKHLVYVGSSQGVKEILSVKKILKVLADGV